LIGRHFCQPTGIRADENLGRKIELVQLWERRTWAAADQYSRAVGGWGITTQIERAAAEAGGVGLVGSPMRYAARMCTGVSPG
jgi:hypothetical protein